MFRPSSLKEVQVPNRHVPRQETIGEMAVARMKKERLQQLPHDGQGVTDSFGTVESNPTGI
jgi:hypothetical protein